MGNTRHPPEERLETKVQMADARARGTDAAQTADGFANFVSRVGLGTDNQLSASNYYFDMLTRNRIKLEAAYRGSWVVGSIVDSVAEDMTRAGISLSTNESEEDIKEFHSYLNRMRVMSALRSGIQWGRLYGGAIAVMQIAGQDPSTPLRIETVGKDQFRGLAVYDRWQLQPQLNDVINEGPNIGLPAYYTIVTDSMSFNPGQQPSPLVGQKVHHSRCFRFIGLELPFFQAVTEFMWGESILERLWDRLVAFDNATMSTGQLVDRAYLRTVQVDKLREIIAGGGPGLEGLTKMFDMMRQLQDNEGLTLLDKEDTFATTAYSFAGLSDVLLNFVQQLSGASQIPLVRLFGQPPAGLSGNADGEIRLYYDNINAKQEAMLRDGLESLVRVMWASRFGVPAPGDLEFSFVPLWQMSAADQANIAKTNTETVLAAFDSGLVDKPTAMKELRGLSGDSGLFSNITDEAVAEAEAEPAPEPDMPPEPDPRDPVANLDSKPGFMTLIRRKVQ